MSDKKPGHYVSASFTIIQNQKTIYYLMLLYENYKSTFTLVPLAATAYT